MSNVQEVLEQRAAMVPAQLIAVKLIDPSPYQPRKYFEEEALASLGATIRTLGLQEAILVRQINERYQLVDGERRLRAWRLLSEDSPLEARWLEIPAKVIQCTDREALRMCGISGGQKVPLRPSERARQVRIYFDDGFSPEEISQELGPELYALSAVRDLLELSQLPESVQEMLDKEELTMAHTSVLSKIPNTDRLVAVAQMARDGGLTATQLHTRTEHLRSNGSAATTRSTTRAVATRSPASNTSQPLMPGELSRRLLLFQRELVNFQDPSSKTDQINMLILQLDNAVGTLSQMKERLERLPAPAGS